MHHLHKGVIMQRLDYFAQAVIFMAEEKKIDPHLQRNLYLYWIGQIIYNCEQALSQTGNSIDESGISTYTDYLQQHSKEDLFDGIIGLPEHFINGLPEHSNKKFTNADVIPLLQAALDKSTYLGEKFYQQRGLRPCLFGHGMLGKIADYLLKIKQQELATTARIKK